MSIYHISTEKRNFVKRKTSNTALKARTRDNDISLQGRENVILNCRTNYDFEKPTLQSLCTETSRNVWIYETNARVQTGTANTQS